MTDPKPILRIRLQGSSADITRTVAELRKVFKIAEDSGTYKENAIEPKARRYLIIYPPQPPKPVRGRRI